MGVNEGTLTDNQARCVSCSTVRERQELRECAICEGMICKGSGQFPDYFSACEKTHFLVEFVGWDFTRGQTTTDAAFSIDCDTLEGPNKHVLLFVREPRWEPDVDDEGSQINHYVDDGWYWASGEELSNEQKGEIEDWVYDLVKDNTRR